MRHLWCVPLILLMISPCHAFKPEEQHGPISSQAIAVYQACTGRAISEELSKAFIEKAVGEDDMSLERMGNWHFYNNGDKIGRYYILFYGSNDKIFRKLVEELDILLESAEPNPKKIYKTAGRIAHHIQDMSTPPHVVPVYHYKDDAFENYTPSSVFRENTPELCGALKSPVVVPDDIFEQAAQNTLKAVASPVVFDSAKTVEKETWKKFWGGTNDKNLDGFKNYGVYGNVFGVIPPCCSPVCRLYSKDTFDRFFNGCYGRAVTDTVRLLFFVDQRLNGRH